jgi:hypothetical protein
MPYAEQVAAYLDFWRKYHDPDGLWHPDDAKWIAEHPRGGRIPTAELLPCGTIVGGRDHVEKNIISNLGPVPYAGCLRSPKILILQCNPSVSSCSILEIGNMNMFAGVAWEEDQERNGFRFIDPMQCINSPGGYLWWAQQISSAIAFSSKRAGVGFRFATNVIRNSIATIDLIPYRSKRKPYCEKTLTSLPSSENAFNLAKSAIEEGIPVLLHNGFSIWRDAFIDRQLDAEFNMCVRSHAPAGYPNAIHTSGYFQMLITKIIEDAAKG